MVSIRLFSHLRTFSWRLTVCRRDDFASFPITRWGFPEPELQVAKKWTVQEQLRQQQQEQQLPPTLPQEHTSTPTQQSSLPALRTAAVAVINEYRETAQEISELRNRLMQAEAKLAVQKRRALTRAQLWRETRTKLGNVLESDEQAICDTAEILTFLDECDVVEQSPETSVSKPKHPAVETKQSAATVSQTPASPPPVPQNVAAAARSTPALPLPPVPGVLATPYTLNHPSSSPRRESPYEQLASLPLPPSTDPTIGATTITVQPASEEALLDSSAQPKTVTLE